MAWCQSIISKVGHPEVIINPLKIIEAWKNGRNFVDNFKWNFVMGRCLFWFKLMKFQLVIIGWVDNGRQAITWSCADKVPCRHMAPFGPNEFI